MVLQALQCEVNVVGGLAERHAQQSRWRGVPGVEGLAGNDGHARLLDQGPGRPVGVQRGQEVRAARLEHGGPQVQGRTTPGELMRTNGIIAIRDKQGHDVAIFACDRIVMT